MPLTSEQRNTLAKCRILFESTLEGLFGTAESVDVRARLPDPNRLPKDLSIHVEVAPPFSHSHPLLPGRALKVPERVPVYFHALHSDQAQLAVADTLVILFIHGGGNVNGHPTDAPCIDFYSRILRSIALRSGDARKCILIAPSYRLATIPENTFPAALQDLVAAYDYVLGKGYKASNIVVAGDSAGGSHALGLTHLILESDRPAPRGVIPIAPNAVVAFDHLSDLAKANTDKDMLNIPILERTTSAYIGDAKVSLTDPLVSTAFIPFTVSWPKTLILVGTGDVLIDSARELERRLLAATVPVESVEYEDLPHIWWVLPDLFPEAVEDATQRITQFILGDE